METTTLSAHDWKEWRRLRTWELKQQGWLQKDIADALDVSKEVVSRWLRRVRDLLPVKNDLALIFQVVKR